MGWVNGFYISTFISCYILIWGVKFAICQTEISTRTEYPAVSAEQKNATCNDDECGGNCPQGQSGHCWRTTMEGGLLGADGQLFTVMLGGALGGAAPGCPGPGWLRCSARPPRPPSPPWPRLSCLWRDGALSASAAPPPPTPRWPLPPSPLPLSVLLPATSRGSCHLCVSDNGPRTVYWGDDVYIPITVCPEVLVQESSMLAHLQNGAIALGVAALAIPGLAYLAYSLWKKKLSSRRNHDSRKEVDSVNMFV